MTDVKRTRMRYTSERDNNTGKDEQIHENGTNRNGST